MGGGEAFRREAFALRTRAEMEAGVTVLAAAAGVVRGTRDEMPDILVCENDALAIGAIDVIRHTLGLRIPEDIAVTGFDDVPQCQSPNYALTTYRQPLTEMAEYLVEVLESSEDRDFDRAFKGTLVPRASA